MALKAGQFSVRVAVMSYRYLPSALVLTGWVGQETCDGFYTYFWFEKTNLFELPSLPIQWKNKTLFLSNQRD